MTWPNKQHNLKGVTWPNKQNALKDPPVHNGVTLDTPFGARALPFCSGNALGDLKGKRWKVWVSSDWIGLVVPWKVPLGVRRTGLALGRLRSEPETETCSEPKDPSKYTRLRPCYY